VRYTITAYTKRKAKELGVVVKPAKNKSKKLDVYKKEKKVASVGAKGYNDYPTYIKKKGKKYADERRRLYKIRHKKDRTKIGTPGWYADKLLW
jgi:hypothetical protein|tara:strand:+ start:876 stop:1154 length:279 start_codon:yes stop_codon:yes gene_type:complete